MKYLARLSILAIGLISMSVMAADRQEGLAYFQAMAKSLPQLQDQPSLPKFTQKLKQNFRFLKHDIGAMGVFSYQLADDIQTAKWKKIFNQKSSDWMLYFFAKKLAFRYGDFRSASQLLFKIQHIDRFIHNEKPIMDKIRLGGELSNHVFTTAHSAQTPIQNKILYTLSPASLSNSTGDPIQAIIVAGNGVDFVVYNPSDKSVKKVTVNDLISYSENEEALNDYEKNIQ